MENIGFHNENVKFLKHLGLSNSEEILGIKVALVLSEDDKDNENAQEIFMLSANLLSRLFVNIDFVIPSRVNDKIRKYCDRSFEERVAALVGNIFPQGNFNYISRIDNVSDYDGILIVGNGKDINPNMIYIFSNGWNVYINSQNIESTNINPIGASAAACFGSAELFKHVIKPRGVKINNELTFSILNYSTDNLEFNPCLPDNINIKNVTLLGAGAIGSGFVYVLDTLKNLTGTLNIVDGDRYTEGNINRYIISNYNTIGVEKVSHVKKLLEGHKNLKVNTYPMVYDKFKIQHKHIDTLITAVDKRVTRYNVQGDLPRIVIDAATTKSFINIARVDFKSEGACLGCLYKPDESDNLEYQYLSKNLGLSLDRVKYLHDTNEGVDNFDIEVISKKLGKDISSYLGQPINSIYAHEYCGSGMIGEDTTESVVVIAPISFISALAGILIMAELVKDRHFPKYSVNNHFTINTFSTPNPMLHGRKMADPTCLFCSDDDIKDAYIEKWLK